MKLLAIILIVAGVLGLIYGSFTYTKTTHSTSLGPLELSVKDNRTVQIPIGAGIAAVIAGVALFVFMPRRAQG